MPSLSLKSNSLEGGTLLVTGGTGSFGNAIVRRLLAGAIGEIRIFSRDEKKQDDMRRAYNSDRLAFYIGDVRDTRSVIDAMRGVDYVFHAAALKQVPSCEFFPSEAMRTNSMGTENVVDAAVDSGVKCLVMLSTDKAVYPINAMGMSKALAERIVCAKSRAAHAAGTTLCVTRYGNVAASRGSVIPLFVEQIKSRVPLTVTNPAMTRFMMSIDEAVELVLYAFGMAAPGDTFVQRAPASTMGTLCEAIKRVFGSDAPVRVIGTRHGEKLYETLVTREEMVRAEDQNTYYRIPADSRDLNYGSFFSEGVLSVPDEGYTSHGARRLSLDETVEFLRGLDYIKDQIG